MTRGKRVLSCAVLALPLLVVGSAWALDEVASPDLVGALAKELSATPQQAQGAAGALFSLAKTRLKPEEFSQVAAAVPGMDGLLKAAPALDAAKKPGAESFVQAAASSA